MSDINEIIKRIRELEKDRSPHEGARFMVIDLVSLCNEIESLQRLKDIELADTFAGLAMQAMMSNPKVWFGDVINSKDVSAMSFEYSNDMMEARNRNMRKD